jgi:hypothetical protein
MKNFKTYQLAKELFHDCQKLPLKGEMKNQLQRQSQYRVYMEEYNYRRRGAKQRHDK